MIATSIEKIDIPTAIQDARAVNKMNFSKIRFKKLSNSKLLRKFFNFNFAEFIKLKSEFLNGDGYTSDLSI